MELKVTTREQCIKASGIAEDYKDANSVFEALELLLDNEQETYLNDKGSLYIELKQSDDKENKLNDNGNGDDISSILEDFHYLLEVHEHEFEDIYNKLIEECNDNKICELSDCLMMRRIILRMEFH